jgi:hypothetical protein
MQLLSKSISGSMLTLGVVTMGLALAGSASADTFDTTLALPNGLLASSSNLSWYNGSGNQNVQGGWTVVDANGIEIGLRAKLKQVDSVINTPTDDYSVPAGACITAPCDNNVPKPALALWNYEFSVNLRPGGNGTLTLSDITTQFIVKDLTTGQSAPAFDLLGPTGASFASDNSAYGPAGKHTGQTGADWSFQNSENPGFGNFPLTAFGVEAFNPNAARTYEIDLNVFQGTTLLAGTDIEVSAVTPEPSAILLFGTVALGLFLYRRRRLAV